MIDWTELDFWRGNTWPKIKTFLQNEKHVFPSNDLMFRALQLTRFDEVKVVVLGQDPYPTAGHATGLAFSVNPETSLPKSLQNIFKELKDDLGIVRTNGDLTDWAEQGVLLLNTCLTVTEGAPNSHKDIGWGALTGPMIRAVSEHKQNVVFILWGKHAQQKGACIDRNKHFVIESTHPSPLAAHNGFFGSKCFSKTNAYLESNNLKAIRW